MGEVTHLLVVDHLYLVKHLVGDRWMLLRLLVVERLTSVALVIGLVICTCSLVFVALLDSEKDLAAFVSEFGALQALSVFVVDFSLGALSILNILVIYESMGPILCLRVCLLHPDGSDFAIAGEHALKSCLVWQS